MGSVISKTANAAGVHRYLNGVDETRFNSDDWEYNPDVSQVTGIRKRYWKYDGTNIVKAQSQEAQTAIDAETNEYQNDFGTTNLAWRGVVRNRWLKGGAGLGIDSRRQPLLLTSAGIITGLAFSNYYNSAGCDIEIYINNVKVHTWEIRNMRYATKSSGLGGVTFKSGDKLSVFARSVTGQRVSWISLDINYRYTILERGEGGSPTL